MTFGEAARIQQGQFLTSSSYFSPAARSRTTAKEKRNHHLLALGCQTENLFPSLRTGIATDFFTSRAIKWWSSSRSGDDSDFDGPTRNLASSQVACVNFLLPLRDQPKALVALLRTIDPDVKSVHPIRYTAKGTSASCNSLVELEWVGLTSTLEGAAFTRGANATSADALIIASTTTGAKRAYIFEWKFVEEYESDADKGTGKSGATRRKRYEQRYRDPASPFNGTVPLDALLYEPFYQLMRLHLLGAKMISEQEFGVTEARVVVVCPTENTAYRTRITSPALREAFPGMTVSEIMKKITRKPSVFRSTSQRELLEAVRALPRSGLKEWIDYQAARYGG